jgi:uncharacterized protein
MDKQVDLEFLEYLVKSIVDHPDDVKIERSIDQQGVLLRLKVNLQDMGQVVGRQGATAKAIRSLLRIVGIKNNAHVNLKIEEPDGSTRPPRPPREGGVPMREMQAPVVPQQEPMGPIADELVL